MMANPKDKSAWRRLQGTLNDPDSPGDIAERHDHYLGEAERAEHEQGEMSEAEFERESR